MFNERDRRCAVVQLMHSADPSYDNRTIASTRKSGRFNAWGHSSMHRTTLRTATFMFFGVVSSEDHIMPPHIFEVGLKVNTWMCWIVWWSSGTIRWPVADPGCGSRTRRRPTSPKRPRFDFRRSTTTSYPSLTAPPSPPTWTRWTTSFGHTSRTSLT